MELSTGAAQCPKKKEQKKEAVRQLALVWKVAEPVKAIAAIPIVPPLL